MAQEQLFDWNLIYFSSHKCKDQQRLKMEQCNEETDDEK
jgi:hypothetical protein